MDGGGAGGGQDYAQVGMQSSWAKCLEGCSKEAQREVRELLAKPKVLLPHLVVKEKLTDAFNPLLIQH